MGMHNLASVFLRIINCVTEHVGFRFVFFSFHFTWSNYSFVIKVFSKLNWKDLAFVRTLFANL